MTMAEVVDIDGARSRRADLVESRVPPMDIDAEAAVISGVLLATGGGGGGGLDVLVDFLRPEHMYSEAHRRILEAAIEVRREGVSVDVVTVGTWLKRTDRIAQVGGMSYMTELLNAAPAVTNKSLIEYATIVHEKWRVRQAIAMMQREAARGYLDYGSAQEYVDGAARQLVHLAGLGVADRGRTNIEVLTDIVRAANAAGAAANEPASVKRGIPTGFPSLDALTSGLHARELTEIVAGSGVGKTTLALAIALHVASLGIGVQIFSPEQTKDELLKKALCMRAEVPQDRLAIGKLSQDEWSRVMTAASDIGKLPIEIDERPRLHIGQICARVRSAVEQARVLFNGAPLGLVIVDHLHHLETEPGTALRRGNEKYDSLYHSTKRFKQLLQEVSLPGLLLAQMRTFDAKGTQARPPKGSTEHCKAVEQLCDRVINLWKPWHKPSIGGRYQIDESRTFAIIVKKRHGSTGEVEFQCVAKQDRFIDANAQTDDRVNPMLATSRAYVDTTPAAASAGEDDGSIAALFAKRSEDA